MYNFNGTLSNYSLTACSINFTSDSSANFNFSLNSSWSLAFRSNISWKIYIPPAIPKMLAKSSCGKFSFPNIFLINATRCKDGFEKLHSTQEISPDLCGGRWWPRILREPAVWSESPATAASFSAVSRAAPTRRWSCERESRCCTWAPRRARGAVEVSERGEDAQGEAVAGSRGLGARAPPAGWGCQEIGVRWRRDSPPLPLARHCIVRCLVPPFPQPCEVSRHDAAVPLI